MSAALNVSQDPNNDSIKALVFLIVIIVILLLAA